MLKNKIKLITLLLSISTSLCAYALDIPANNYADVVDSANINSQENIKNLNYKKSKNFKIEEIKKQNSEIEVLNTNFKFKLNGIKISGNSIYSSNQLEKFAIDYYGQEITFKEVNEITHSITELYRNDGYLSSVAYVPAQSVKDGVLNINIVEGKVGTISIEGNKWAKTSYLENTILKGNNVKNEQIFNVKNLRNSMYDVEESKYLKGQIILKRGKMPETTDIKLRIEEKAPLGLGLSWDNTGRELIGNQRAGISTSIYNLTGYGDSLYVNPSFSSRTFALNSGYSVPLGNKGTKFNFGYSLSDVELGGIYKSQKIESNTHNFSAGLEHPLYKGERLKLNGKLVWDMRHSEITLKNINLDKYELRVLRTGIDGRYDDPTGRTYGGLFVSTGIPILGGQNNTGYGISSSKFVKLNTNLIRVQKLPYKTIGVIKTGLQLTPDVLKAPEQLQMGGMYTVRGFNEGTLLGDNGYYFSAELSRAIPYMQDIKIAYMPDKIKTIPLKNKVHMAAFYDQGFTRMHQQGQYKRSKNFMQSLGFGIRYYLTKYIVAKVDFAFPLGREIYPGQNTMKVHFRLSSDVI